MSVRHWFTASYYLVGILDLRLLITSLVSWYLFVLALVFSAGFTYRLDRLKPMTSTYRGPPAEVYNILNKVIGHLCCHNVLYFLNNLSVIFLTQLHSISEYCRILNISHHLCRYSNWLSILPSSSSREGTVDLNPALVVLIICSEKKIYYAIIFHVLFIGAC